MLRPQQIPGEAPVPPARRVRVVFLSLAELVFECFGAAIGPRELLVLSLPARKFLVLRSLEFLATHGGSSISVSLGKNKLPYFFFSGLPLFFLNNVTNGIWMESPVAA